MACAEIRSAHEGDDHRCTKEECETSDDIICSQSCGSDLKLIFHESGI
jgi:hypothetical protein